MAQTEMNNAPAQEAPKKKSKAFLFVLIGLVVVGGSFGISKYIHAQHHEETDDAQIDASISPVIPRISGYVIEIRVKDNQKVKAGDTLVVLDNRSELIKVQQMQAALSIAENNLHVANANTQVSKANIASYEANTTTVDAQIESAKVTLRRATQDYERYVNLIATHSITQQQFEQVEYAKQNAEKQLAILTGQKNAAIKQTMSASSQSNAVGQQISVANATIDQKRADVDNARLELAYTYIVAPSDGSVSKINAQVGQYLQAGQMIFTVVANSAPWVVANFKETQCERIRPGQKVTIHIDAFPGHDFEAKVASLSPATGGKFALLPPDNASGNFIKTVQRLPVRIEFTTQDQFLKDIRAGMNVDVDVHLD
jgi:membrane fusion protein (multidrug efflux system)